MKLDKDLEEYKDRYQITLIQVDPESFLKKQSNKILLFLNT